MWIILGIIAIVVTITNLYMYAAGKDYKLAMVLGLSFTALTLCAEHSFVSELVIKEDWSALREVPNYDRALWFFTIFSILLNITPIFLERKRTK